jgi:BirA family transcriptional regulator, biotin operon repressor / biotin---[acetyl-CoA-carboxylase] ligase
VPAPDSLAPEVVEPLLTGRFGRPYLFAERCESTQFLLEPAAGEGAAAVCEEQTAGRGRHGRPWVAPPRSSILCSVLVEPPAGRELPQLSLVGGLAAAEAIERALQLSAQIKWPNDVMVDRRKVAGVLAEARDGRVVLGAGINVNQTLAELPDDARVAPASLRVIDGLPRPRAPLLADYLATLERLYALWRDGGLDAIYDGLGARDFLRGRRVFVDGAAGTGVAIRRDGAFEAEFPDGRRVLESGEVEYER